MRAAQAALSSQKAPLRRAVWPCSRRMCRRYRRRVILRLRPDANSRVRAGTLREDQSLAVVPNWRRALDDDSTVTFRPIQPADKAQLLDGFTHLSTESKYRRFLTPLRDLSEARLRFLTELDFVNHFAYVAELSARAGRPGIGVGRWIRDGAEPDRAEMAVTVADEYQGHGIGGDLIHLLAWSAVFRGIRTLTALVLSSNKPMLALLEGVGARQVGHSEGTIDFAFDLPGDLAVVDSLLAKRGLEPNHPRG